MGNCPTRLGRAIKNDQPEKVEQILKEAGKKAPSMINNDHSPDCIMDSCNPTIGNAFYNSVFKNRTQIVKIMLKYGADIYSLGYNDETSLHCAARLNNLEVVRMLIDAGCDVYCTDDMGHFTIHSAARSVFNTKQTIMYLISIGNKDDVNLRDYTGRTPLHDAICMGTIHVVKLLIEYGADVNARTKLGNTPLYFAKSNNKTEIYDLLIANGAEPTVPRTPTRK